MEKMTKNILITGAGGYLGGRIYTVLTSLGYTCILASRSPEKISLIFPSAKSVAFDISDPGTFKDALVQIDGVIHLASTNHQDSEKDPELAHFINVEMTQKLVKAAIEAKVKQFIYFSTFHIYGSSSGIINENTLPAPLTTYAKSHLEAEKAVLDFKKFIDTKVIRLSNAIGFPLNNDKTAWALVVNDLCRQATSTHTLELKSSGYQKRDFVPAELIGHALNTLLESQNEDATPIYNLGAEKTYSILDVAKMIQKISKDEFGKSLSINQLSQLPDKKDVPDFLYQCTKLRDLGFISTVSLEDEIRSTLHNLNNNSESKT